MTITESERMALCDVLIDYMLREDHIQEWTDVARGVTTTVEGLLLQDCNPSSPICCCTPIAWTSNCSSTNGKSPPSKRRLPISKRPLND